ncbi:hypothetical protein ACU4GD_35030 [Cupriavidus basilensis]
MAALSTRVTAGIAERRLVRISRPHELLEARARQIHHRPWDSSCQARAPHRSTSRATRPARVNARVEQRQDPQHHYHHTVASTRLKLVHAGQVLPLTQ